MKINVALVNGLAIIYDLEWDAFNEGNRLQESILKYRATFGYNPKYPTPSKAFSTSIGVGMAESCKTWRTQSN